MNILGKRIKSLRKGSHLNQIEFANILNISNSTLSQYETGQRVPSDDIKIKIAEYFQVSTDYLLGVSNNKNTSKEIPEEFSSPEEAMQFILNDNTIMGFGGFDVNKMSDDEVIEFANELLNQLRILRYKYKK